MENRLHNFNPGPGVLPVEVLLEFRENLLSFEGTGIGLMEMSHRSTQFEHIIGEAEANLRELLGLSADYAVLFTTGGATMQFSMVPMNLLSRDKTSVGDYLLSGVWAEAAYEEAKNFGSVHIAGSSKDDGYRAVPRCDLPSPSPRYLHFTSNNTVIGSQYSSEPRSPEGVPLVCDASSDILSRRIEIDRYGVIYAGAQKNLGPAGVTIVIIRNDLLDSIPHGLPMLLDYRTYARNRSLHNTPPTSIIYAVGLMLKWLKRLGGVEAIEQRNRTKAALVYDALDRSPIYRGVVDHESRSMMNVTFRLQTPELEASFLLEAERRGLIGLKGHRLVGGCRASLYNACPTESVTALVGFLDDFAALQGRA